MAKRLIEPDESEPPRKRQPPVATLHAEMTRGDVAHTLEYLGFVGGYGLLKIDYDVRDFLLRAVWMRFGNASRCCFLVLHIRICATSSLVRRIGLPRAARILWHAPLGWQQARRKLACGPVGAVDLADQSTHRSITLLKRERGRPARLRGSPLEFV